MDKTRIGEIVTEVLETTVDALIYYVLNSTQNALQMCRLGSSAVHDKSSFQVVRVGLFWVFLYQFKGKHLNLMQCLGRAAVK